MSMDLASAILTVHAIAQMQRRQVSETQVRQVLASPEEVCQLRPGRVVAQSMIGHYLFRVFVDIDRLPPEVVTAYRTSQVHKYKNRP